MNVKSFFSVGDNSYEMTKFIFLGSIRNHHRVVTATFICGSALSINITDAQQICDAPFKIAAQVIYYKTTNSFKLVNTVPNFSKLYLGLKLYMVTVYLVTLTFHYHVVVFRCSKYRTC